VASLDPSRVPKTGEVVADHIRRQIVHGELQVGDYLRPEDELTAEFGVARTTLREALRILETQGLIRIRRGRGGGGVVTVPDLERLAKTLAVALQLQHTTIGDLDEARQLLEPQLVARLAESHTAEDLAALEAVIETASQAAEADDTEAFGLAVTALHEMIMERSGNRTLATLSRLLHELVLEYYERSASRSDQTLMRRAVRSHHKLLRLLSEGNAKEAEEHWQRHMSFTIDAQDRDEPLDAFDDAI
jgi:DNA-binding FadR family transcriptional regulator